MTGPCPCSPVEILNALSLSLSSGSLCLALHLTGSLRNSSSRISLDRSPSLILSSGLVFVFLSPSISGRLGALPTLAHATQPAIEILPMRIFSLSFSFKVRPLGVEIKANYYFYLIFF